jgi:WD40 repeat protein
VWKYFPEDKAWALDQNLNELGTAATKRIQQQQHAVDEDPNAASTSSSSSSSAVICVRDVNWAPNSNGLPFSYLAACTDDGSVVVWRQDGTEGIWQHAIVQTGRPATIPVCRLHWSSAGSVLVTVWRDGQSAMWLENQSGAWELAARKADQ